MRREWWETTGNKGSQQDTNWGHCGLWSVPLATKLKCKLSMHEVWQINSTPFHCIGLATEIPQTDIPKPWYIKSKWSRQLDTISGNWENMLSFCQCTDPTFAFLIPIPHSGSLLIRRTDLTPVLSLSWMFYLRTSLYEMHWNHLCVRWHNASDCCGTENHSWQWMNECKGSVHCILVKYILHCQAGLILLHNCLTKRIICLKLYV